MQRKYKTQFFTSLILTGCLTLGGCLGGGRGWFSFKKSGENATLAADGAEARMTADQQREVQRLITESAKNIRDGAKDIRKHNSSVTKTIAEDAPQIIGSTSEHTQAIDIIASETEIEAKSIMKASKEQENFLKKFSDFAEGVVSAAKGKTKIPMALIILAWTLGIGIALSLINSAIPLRIILTPFANIFSAVFSTTADIVSGSFKEEQELKYEHWDRTKTIANEEMPLVIQEKLLKHRIKKQQTLTEGTTSGP